MLNNRYVRTIILSRVFLQLGIWIRNFAVLLYVTDLTRNDPYYVSLISVVEYAPIFLFAMIGGTLADRWRPKRTMVWCDLLSAASVLGVLLVLLYGTWLALLLGTLVSASLSQFSQPSAMKLYKRHVPAEQLQGVMAMSQTLVSVFMILGPMIGTFIFLQYGIEISLALTVMMFSASALILSTLPKDSKEDRSVQTGDFMKELKEGIRYLWGNRSLRVLSVTFAVTGLAAGLTQPLLLFVTIDQLGLDKSFLQWLFLTNGAAMLAGGVLIVGAAKRVKPQVLLLTGLVGSALVTVVTGASTMVGLTVAVQIIGGLAYAGVQAGIQTMIMQNTGAALIGRVSGAITPMFMGMMVIGMSLSGYFKELFSLFMVYSISGGLLVIGALLLTPLLVQRKMRKQA
ncbi:MFS transporter [Paenibacillus medicaginis]|uniref:MFS transporter n=1 Tax=Paenibacillus medicaginis TaxID=1470560 RepID=A0ABV5C786_9BACL